MRNRSTILMVILPVLACFAFLPEARAICNEGCGSNFNTFEGENALISDTTGFANTAFGWYTLFANTDGSYNTAVGTGALDLNTGSSNTAIGAAALLLNTTGTQNTAIGTAALVNNAADDNTAVGAFALQANTTGGTLEHIVVDPGPPEIFFDVGPNTAVGSGALESDTDSSGNTAVGYQALGSMVTGLVGQGFPHLGVSTAVGFQALANANGPDSAGNDAHGYQALFNFIDGVSNVAVGGISLFDLTAGNGNVAVGLNAGSGLTSGDGNIFIGWSIGAGASNESNHTYIRNIDSTSVSGGGTDTVTIDLTTGLLGHLSSSRRYKEDINPMDKASETLYRLKPATYRYKKEIDKTQSLAFGLIAEEVAEANPDLVAHNAQGQPESVHYEMVNAMLLNEFLKEHRAFVEEQRKVEKLECTVADLMATVKEQAAQIQKVNTEIQVSKSVPRLVANPEVVR
jgi:trimeric autotransporter adhesin